MKVILGLGPIFIQRDIIDADGVVQKVRAIYNGYISFESTIVLDIVNNGKINKNGEDMSWTRGLWTEFSLALVDPPLAYSGYSGESHINFIRILNDYVAADRENQWFELIPANSEDSSITFRVKFADAQIKLGYADPSCRQGGNVISMRVRSKDRLTVFPAVYSISDPDELNLVSSII